MIKTYYFRKNEDGFKDWIKEINACKAIVHRYRNFSNEMKEWNKEEYLAAREVYGQYKILLCSLNKSQKEYWNKRIIKKETYDYNYQESTFIWHSIYENLLLIISNRQKLKEIDLSKGGQVLKKAREDSGYFIIQAALIAEISERTLQRYEKGTYFPSLDILYRLLQVYGVSLKEFIKLLK